MTCLAGLVETDLHREYVHSTVRGLVYQLFGDLSACLWGQTETRWLTDIASIRGSDRGPTIFALAPERKISTT
jgi:hypothetical protein